VGKNIIKERFYALLLSIIVHYIRFSVNKYQQWFW